MCVRTHKNQPNKQQPKNKQTKKITQTSLWKRAVKANDLTFFFFNIGTYAWCKNWFYFSINKKERKATHVSVACVCLALKVLHKKLCRQPRKYGGNFLRVGSLPLPIRCYLCSLSKPLETEKDETAPGGQSAVCCTLVPDTTLMKPHTSGPSPLCI